MVRVGLTGGIASGKTAVSDRLRRLGAVVIDSDLLAREVVEPGTPGLAAVLRRFGTPLLSPDGTLDRAALGRIVFADAEARSDLEQIVHPAVRARAAVIEAEAEADADAVVVHVIPLLVETGQAADFDLVVVVDVPPDVQRQRLQQRSSLSADEAESRLAAQAGREDRLRLADYVVNNAGPLSELDRRVRELWSRLQDLTKQR